MPVSFLHDYEQRKESLQQWDMEWTAGVRCLVGTGRFLLLTAARSGLSIAQPLMQWGTAFSFTGVQLSGREADHSLSRSTEVRNTEAIPQHSDLPSWRDTYMTEHGQYFVSISLRDFYQILGQNHKIILNLPDSRNKVNSLKVDRKESINTRRMASIIGATFERAPNFADVRYHTLLCWMTVVFSNVIRARTVHVILEGTNLF
jgi:hypothetical protein